MAQEKIIFEQFIEMVETDYRAFIQSLHTYLLDNECKATIEDKKSGLFVSYKHVKSKKVIANVLLRKKGMFVRIYGENAHKYLDFLNTLPAEMVHAIDSAHECKRLTANTCSLKCSGYDVTIGSRRFQKCRYGGFEFLVTDKNNSYIKLFVENEVKERAAGCPVNLTC